MQIKAVGRSFFARCPPCSLLTPVSFLFFGTPLATGLITWPISFWPLAFRTLSGRKKGVQSPREDRNAVLVLQQGALKKNRWTSTYTPLTFEEPTNPKYLFLDFFLVSFWAFLGKGSSKTP
jgi:hypothetical protein